MGNKKLIYVCSKYSGDIEKNTQYAMAYCRAIYRCGQIPIAPHLYFTRFLNDDNQVEREDGLQMGLKLLSMCDEMWVFDGDISKGMKQEIEFATKHNIPITECIMGRGEE